jgi:hypothetical protein
MDMLIGAELFFNLRRPGKYIGNGRVPTLQETELGWILAGRIQHPGQPADTSCLALEENRLDAQLQRFWAVEEFHTLPKTTQELECESHFQATITRDDTGRFVVQLPRKLGHEGLGSPYDQARYRFQPLEKRLQHQPEIRKNYAEFMKEYEELGQMQLVSGGGGVDGKETFYLPHHPVFKHDSSTTRLRVVFYASAKSTNGQSLNDTLMI